MTNPSPASSAEARDDGAAATIDAWRRDGADRLDPVRFRFIEALARRAAAHGGEARRILDARLAGLLAAYGEEVAKASSPARAEVQNPPPPRGALAELVERIDRHAAAEATANPNASAAMPGTAPVAELKTLRYFRGTWSKLSAERRLTQSLAKMPENAGPLNSHHLVHRALTLMRDLSPEYLNKFMSYVDGLLWLDDMNIRGTSATGAQGAEAGKKSGRGKAR